MWRKKRHNMEHWPTQRGVSKRTACRGGTFPTKRREIVSRIFGRVAFAFLGRPPPFLPLCPQGSPPPLSRLSSPSVPFALAFRPVCSRPCVPYVALSTQHRPLPFRLPPKRLQLQKPPPWRPLVSTKQGLCLHVVPCKQRPCELASLASVGGYFFRSSLTSVPSVV